jgi:cellulose synthase/poly-beta-1,6-N-acetylglucosamine synthase-like glycosyltransferase
MYNVVVISSALFLSGYLLIIFLLIKGWNKIPYFEMISTSEFQNRISVVVCCRNEAHHLPVLIEALKAQTNQHFELIWVNDHSTDHTLQIMHSTVEFFEHVQIVNVLAKGKKQAMKAGVIAASGDLIVTTDADCLPAQYWLESISSFQQHQKADLIIAPVKLFQGDNLFTHLQQLEFSTLVGTGMGAAGVDMPILCNAANMAFTKQAWLESAADLHEEEISGDDVFLLLSIKKRNGKIAVLKSREAMVSTGYKKSLSSFINQRRRWASKSSKYTDWHVLSTGIIVAGVNFLLFALFVMAFFFPQLWLVFLSAFIIKFMTDNYFLQFIHPLFLFKLNVLNVLALSLVYPVYVTFVGISSLIWKRKNW